MREDKYIPDWTNKPPLKGSFREIGKIGKQGDVKTPSDQYFRQLKKELGLNNEDFQTKHDGNVPVSSVPGSNLDPRIISAISEIVGEENIQIDDFHRVKYSYGKLAEEYVSIKRGVLHEITGAAVHPRNKGDVKKLVALCNEEKVPIYVYGGGSSAAKGLLPEKEGITLVLNTHLNKVLEVNELNQTCRVQAGCMGPELEEVLNNAPELFNTKHRFTNGHFPQSFELSSVGGWVLTLGSGQASTYYGEPYNLVLGMEMITPAGIINTSEYITTATGPKVLDMLKGSEGAFGVLVELTIKIFRYMPENRKYFGYIFPDWESGVNATREICQGEFGLPAILRLSDSDETDHGFQMYPQPKLVEWGLTRLGYKPGKRCFCIGTIEGDRDFTKLVRKKISRIVRKHGALSITGKSAKDWEKDRYSSFLVGEAITDFDIILDTVETPVQWDNLHHIHDSVLDYGKSKPGTFCISHASHFYPSGTNLYFIYGIKGTVQDYIEYRTGIIDAMVKAGGSPSHHHGVGRLLNQWIEGFLGSEEMDVIRSLKEHFDPNNIMNRGTILGLDMPDDQKR